jgi:hypothetical protein
MCPARRGGPDLGLRRVQGLHASRGAKQLALIRAQRAQLTQQVQRAAPQHQASSATATALPVPGRC